jgi:Fe2+ transport system protein FeoA
MKRLSELTPGTRARVLRINSNCRSGQRLREMGLINGVRFEVVRFAPLGDPVEIRLHGYHLSLRKNEAESVEVELEAQNC